MDDYTRSVPENATDEQLAEIKDARAAARKIISLVRANYYPGKVEPTNEQIRFAIGPVHYLIYLPFSAALQVSHSIPLL